ncbi:MAG TPA: M20/M25/M40 family metallo-hydrolase [bacterium]|nr:M20/M25/M40 family metallo-hydrolase [bacterium]
MLPRAPADGREAEWTASWSVPAPEKVEIAQRNVVGLLRAKAGGAHADEYIVISAHYDHIGVGRAVDGDMIYNGADDDATGTTAVLLLAEALARQKAALPRNVLFVCFAGEERGLRGSRAFCERPPVPLDRVVANLNIEMIGRPLPQNVGKAWITGESYSDFAEILREPLGRTGVELVPFEMAKMLFAASDNYSFVNKGVVAHSISAGSLHRDYHRPSDEVDKLDIPHMTRIIRALYDATVELASRERAPAWSEAGKKVRERMRR